MTYELKHARWCLYNAQYWLGQAIKAMRKSKEMGKNKTIPSEMFETIGGLYDGFGKMIEIIMGLEND